MGHEYMELKQTSAAIQAYRHAIGLLIVALDIFYLHQGGGYAICLSFVLSLCRITAKVIG